MILGKKETRKTSKPQRQVLSCRGSCCNTRYLVNPPKPHLYKSERVVLPFPAPPDDAITQTCPYIMQRFLKAVKKLIFRCEKGDIFYLLLKTYIVCVHIRTASVRVPTIYVWEQKQENNVYPCKPKFYSIKVGSKGSALHGYGSMVYTQFMLA